MDKLTAEKILSFATALKADAADVYLRSSTSTSVEVKEQKVDAFERAEDRGAGLRVLLEGRLGFAFTTDLSDNALKALAEAAVTNARNTEPDPFLSIPEKPAIAYQEPSIFDQNIVDLTDAEKINRVMSMEREARLVDPRITRIRKASAGFSVFETLIMNIRGADVYYKSTACSSGIDLVAEEKGESQSGSEYDVDRFYRNLEIEETGRRAARKALALLGAKHIDSTKAPAILESTVVHEFLGVIAGGFSAEAVQKKRSLFMGKLDQEVASGNVNIIDDGFLESGLGTTPCDDELVPMTRKTIIDRGRLKQFLHNTYTANKDKTVSTGNGMRGGFKGVPGVGITNLYIEPGGLDLEDLVKSMYQGLLVTDVMGMHTANAISGDFSVGAVGFWITRGKRAYPVREITIAGNLLDLLKSIDAVGSDMRLFGRIGCPSLRISELSIGGK